MQRHKRQSGQASLDEHMDENVSKNKKTWHTLEEILEILKNPDADKVIVEAVLGCHTALLPSVDLLNFLASLVDDGCATPVRLMSDLLKLCPELLARNYKVVNAFLAKTSDATPEERSRLNSIKLSILKSKSCNQLPVGYSTLSSIVEGFDAIEPRELAVHLTIKDYKLYSAIPLEQVVELTKSPAATEMARRSNKVSFWVSTCILSHEDIVGRAECICKLIECLKECIALQNLNAFTVINASLNSVAITRLKATWELVPAKLRLAFESLQCWVDTRSNYLQCRTLHETTKQPTIPFLGIFLRDLTFLFEGKSLRVRPKRRAEKSSRLGNSVESCIKNTARCATSTSKEASCTKSASQVDGSLDHVQLCDKLSHSTPDVKMTRRARSDRKKSSRSRRHTESSFSLPRPVHVDLGNSSDIVVHSTSNPWRESSSESKEESASDCGSEQSHGHKERSKSSEIDNQPSEQFDLSLLLQIWSVVRLFRKFQIDYKYDIASLANSVRDLSPEFQEELNTLPSKTEDELYDLSLKYENKKLGLLPQTPLREWSANDVCVFVNARFPSLVELYDALCNHQYTGAHVEELLPDRCPQTQPDPTKPARPWKEELPMDDQQRAAFIDAFMEIRGKHASEKQTEQPQQKDMQKQQDSQSQKQQKDSQSQKQQKDTQSQKQKRAALPF